MKKCNLALLCLCLLLSACGKKDGFRQGDGPPRHDRFDLNSVQHWTPRPEPLSRYGNHSPYHVHGKSYWVKSESSGFEQTGHASWYGKKFHGKTTSNQEIFDMYKLTAAHRSLPLPSYVQVTNLENGRQVVVRVNDRGPFVDDRIIDLSWAAAKVLGYVEQGVTRVHLKVVNSPQDLKAELTPEKDGVHTFIQVGAFSSNTSATNLARQISNLLDLEVYVNEIKTAAGRLFRVRVGPVDQAGESVRLRDQLIARGVGTATIVTE